MPFIPFLAHKCDVEFIPLELFARICHHVIKGAFEQVLSSDDQPFTKQTGVCIRSKCFDRLQFSNVPMTRIIAVSHSCTKTHILDFSWPLTIALGFKLPVKIAQLGFKVPAIWSRCSGSLRSCQYQHTVSSRLCTCVKLFLVVKYCKLLRMSPDTIQ